MTLKTMATVLLVGLMFGNPTAQHKDMPSKRRQDMFGRDLFLYRYYNFADSSDASKSRMEFHVAVVNDLLTFIKTAEDEYKARYEVNVVIYDDEMEPLVEKSVSGRVTVHSFAKTNSRRNAMHHTISTSLDPGRYKSVLQLIDFESNESISKELDLTVRDFSRDKIRISDIMFIDTIDSTDSGVVYSANLPHVFDNVNSAFAAYVEIYPPDGINTAEADIEILDAKGKMLHSFKRRYESKTGAVHAVIPFREYLKKPGEYLLVIIAKAGEHSAKSRRMFSVIWSNIPLAENNLELAINQLALVAKKNDIEIMRNAKGNERKKLYDDYWQQRDPTPLTKKNELQEEFFRRVDFANRNFSEITSNHAGWQTDRGKIYIVYGPPDEVSHSDSEIQMPATEIWYYNRLGRKYYFSDRSGDGVYRLVKVE